MCSLVATRGNAAGNDKSAIRNVSYCNNGESSPAGTAWSMINDTIYQTAGCD